MTPAQGRKQRRELMKQIAADHRRHQREHLAALKLAIRDARAARKVALVHAKSGCKNARAQARQRASELRARALVELREAIRLDRAAARDRCAVSLKEARELPDRPRRELAAERQYRREMRQIEKGHRARRAELRRSSAKARGLESDEEVAGNIPPELAGLWQRVKKGIRSSDRMTRTEAFLHYAEENPREVLEALEDKTEEVLADLMRQEKEARRAYARPIPRRVAQESEAPF